MRKGDYIGTYTGKQFWLPQPEPDDVCIEDIAHSLSQICRFNGHTQIHYSVAAHCLNVSHHLKKIGHIKITQLYGLLHDASEAYICDIPKPLKAFLPEYREIEERVQKVIYTHFGLEWPQNSLRDSIKLADNYILALEAKAFMKNTADWDLVETDMGDKLYYLGDGKPMKARWIMNADRLLEEARREWN